MLGTISVGSPTLLVAFGAFYESRFNQFTIALSFILLAASILSPAFAGLSIFFASLVVALTRRQARIKKVLEAEDSSEADVQLTALSSRLKRDSLSLVSSILAHGIVVVILLIPRLTDDMTVFPGTYSWTLISFSIVVYGLPYFILISSLQGVAARRVFKRSKEVLGLRSKI